MATDTGSADPRFGQLADEIAELARRVDLLSRRVDALSGAEGGDQYAALPVDREADGPRAASGIGELSTILTVSATVSFLLVVALVLRTIVDNGVVDRTAGTWVGIAYAALIVAFGHARHATGARRAPVYSTCGAVLLLSIVAESHVRFATLSTGTAYGLLTAAMAALSATGFWFASAAPLVAATLGVCAVALALDFPHPPFVIVMPLVLTANVIAFRARGIPGCAWLKWALLGLSMGIWALWTTQLRAALLRHETLPPHTTIAWYLPALASFAVCYLVVALWSFGRDRRGGAWFAPLLVVVNAAWSYGCAILVAGPWLAEQRLMAATVIVIAGGHALGAAAFARTTPPNRAAVVSLTWAGLLLLALALPRLAGNDLAVVTWAAVAAGLGVAAARTGFGGLRLSSYLYQGFAIAMATALGVLAPTAAQQGMRILSLAAMSALSIAHYQVCRRSLAGCDPSRLTLCPEDRLGVLPLAIGLVYLFAGLRVALYAWLAAEGAPIEGGFQSAQSMLIVGMAVALMTIGCMRRNGELFVMSLVVGALGAVRVFGYDLLTIHGLPLVWSVLSFGLATAVGSLLWRSWQRFQMRESQSP